MPPLFQTRPHPGEPAPAPVTARLATGLLGLAVALAPADPAPALPEPTGQEIESAPAPKKTPMPPEPCSDDFDWIRFTNGEWLKGEIKELQDDRLLFESDQLGDLSLDLDDIYAIHSPKTNIVMLKDRTLVQGTVNVEGDRLTATTAETKRTFTRDEVRSVITGKPSERNFWSGSVGLGVSLRRGNVDQTDISGTFRLQRRDPGTRLALTYDGAYSIVNEERTANNHKADASYDVYVTERLYLRPAAISYFRDEFQNIDYRIIPGAGFGYQIIDDADLSWTAGAGFGWQFERFIEAPPGRPQQSDSSALTANTGLEWDATAKTDVGLTFDITIPTDAFSGWNARTTVYTEIDLWSDFDLDVRLIWDRNNSPTPDSRGVLPKKDDVRLFVGVNLDF